MRWYGALLTSHGLAYKKQRRRLSYSSQMDSALPNASHATLNGFLDFGNNTEKLTEGYDNLASKYDMFHYAVGWLGPVQTARKVLEVEPNQNARILDVGCGTGMGGLALWEAGYRKLYGVDMSDTSLKVAGGKGAYFKLILGTIGPKTPLDYVTGYFDLAYSTGCFLPNHLNESHLPEMIRLVKQGGYLVIITRKIEFEREMGDLKLKSGLRKMVEENILKKISHEDIAYKIDRNMQGVTLCYRVI